MDLNSSPAALPLHEIFEIRLDSYLAANSEDVAGDAVRVKLHVVSGARPHIACPAEKIMRLIRTVDIDLQLLERQSNKAGLAMMWIEINHHH